MTRDEQSLIEAARLAAQKAQEEANLLNAQVAAANYRAALQEEQPEVERTAQLEMLAQMRREIERLERPWLVSDDDLSWALEWAVKWKKAHPAHADLLRRLLAEIDGWRAQEAAR